MVLSKWPPCVSLDYNDEKYFLLIKVRMNRKWIDLSSQKILDLNVSEIENVIPS